MSPPVSCYLHKFTTAALYALLITALPYSTHAQVWECAGQYTNHPEGKGACQAAGGIKSCGSDGNRYFSPRKAAEQPSVAICGAGGSGRSPFVDMREKKLSQFGGSGIHERLVAPARETQSSKKKRLEQPRIEPEKASTVEDVFSCFSNPDKLKLCSPEGLGRFVEQTFMNASKALQQ